MLNHPSAPLPLHDSAASGFPVFLESLGEGSPVHKCIMLGMELGNILLDCEASVDPSTEVVLAFDRLRLSGTVRYSNPRLGRHRISVAISEAESAGIRIAPRFPMDEPGTLIALTDDSAITVECRLTDISSSGLGLDSPLKVEPGTMVCVETNSFMMAGTVQRCALTDRRAFHLGVAVTDVVSDRRMEEERVLPVSGFRLRLAEFILGRPIDSVQRALHPFRPR